MKALPILLLLISATFAEDTDHRRSTLEETATPAVESLLSKMALDLGDGKNILAQQSGQPSWWRRPDRVALGLFSITSGEFFYETRGSAAPHNTRAGMPYYRFLFEYFGGVEISFGESDPFRDGSGTVAQVFDLFLYGGYPNQFHPRIRARPRFGLFFQDYNLKNVTLGDVESRAWGFRLEVELELDIIKKPTFLLSTFIGGRIAYGWGDGTVQQLVGRTKENATTFGWGWQFGFRFNINQFYFAVSWISREDEYRASVTFSRAYYTAEGLTFSFGIRF